MQIKRIVYYIAKFSLIDELLGFIYWVLAIYGMYIIIEHTFEGPLLAAALAAYVLAVIAVYMILLKRLKAFFKSKQGAASEQQNRHL